MREPEHQVKFISEYVEGQTQDEIVTNAERLLSTKVLGNEHEVWDVRTNADRYWVVTNPTNLYSHDDIKTADYALTFHIGIGVRLAERGRVELDDEVERHVDIGWRKYRQAVDAYNTADEAEAYQAVGVRCRESLIALARKIAGAVAEEIASSDSRPQTNAFTAWSEIGAEQFSKDRLRSYLKDVSKKAWDLAVWLQHYDSATPWDAELVLDATQHVLSMYGTTFRRYEMGQPERCPRCDSYRVDNDGGTASEEPYVQWTEKVCGSCEHRWERGFIRWDQSQHTWVSTEDPGLSEGDDTVQAS